MNNKQFANLGFLAIALAIVPMTLSKCFEHKSHKDVRSKYSLT